MIGRAKQLAVSLSALGVQPGDRVATLSWNHDRHLETYFAIPAIGAVLHTLNLRLHPNELASIVQHAGDRILLVDEMLLPLWEQIRERVSIEHTIVLAGGGARPPGTLDY